MVYGKEFAKIYDEKWTAWGAKMWPFLFRLVKENCSNAFSWLDLCCGTGALLEYVSKRVKSPMSAQEEFIYLSEKEENILIGGKR